MTGFASDVTKQKVSAYTVIAIVEAQHGKKEVLKQALLGVLELSRNEKACLEYRLHEDLTNPAQFVLYEIWESKQAHAEQFSKPYIVELAAQLPNLLAKPYQVIFAHEIL